jgi:hypothetical protein
MQTVSKEKEAEIRRQRADMIRRHVHIHGIAMGLQSQLAWLGVAEQEIVLAEALELKPLKAVGT